MWSLPQLQNPATHSLCGWYFRSSRSPFYIDRYILFPASDSLLLCYERRLDSFWVLGTYALHFFWHLRYCLELLEDHRHRARTHAFIFWLLTSGLWLGEGRGVQMSVQIIQFFSTTAASNPRNGISHSCEVEDSEASWVPYVTTCYVWCASWCIKVSNITVVNSRFLLTLLYIPLQIEKEKKKSSRVYALSSLKKREVTSSTLTTTIPRVYIHMGRDGSFTEVQLSITNIPCTYLSSSY